MSELRHIDARTVLVGDLHAHVINLANVLRHPALGPMLIRDLRRLPFHEYQLRHSQDHMLRVETRGFQGDPEVEGMETSYVDALNYFVCAWMSRNGKAGTAGEFTAGFSVRWDAGGGDSALRFRNAVEALRDWRRVFARCTFVVMDVFDFLAKVKDEPGHGVYLDPPFPDAGKPYQHNCGDTPADQRAWHVRLRNAVERFTRCRVVCRFYAHPLIEELYPRGRWAWSELTGRKQSNAAGPEVLLTREGTG